MTNHQNRQGNISWRQPIFWILTGFLISYMLFFIRPVFFSPEHKMQFKEYVPALNTIGADLRQAIGLSRDVLIRKQPAKVEEGLCIPAQCFMLAPLMYMDPFYAYLIVTILNITAYLFITAIFPLLISKDKSLSPVLMLVLVTGLFSYGFQFELERGNLNIITMFFCFLAIYIFHYHHRFRYFAYLLFSISIQIKLYPGIFILMFVKDWTDWKGNIKRFLGILSFTFAGLFMLGIDYFLLFYRAIKTYALNPIVVWKGNHGIKGFVSYLSSIKYKLPEWAQWISDYEQLVIILLLLFVLGCLFIVLLNVYSQKTTGVNPFLLLTCTLGALLIPSESQDYTLSILAGPVAIFLNAVCISDGGTWRRILSILLITILSVAYSSTLFSYVNKPFLLRSTLPALFVILGASTLFHILKQPVLDPSRVSVEKS